MILPVVTGDLEAVRDFHQVGLLGDHTEACLLAAANGQLEVLKYLHETGCDITKLGSRIVALAAANGRLAIIQYLHCMGCDLRAEDDIAITEAALKNHSDVLKYLHEQGCNIHACGRIAPSLSLSVEHKPVVDYLASQGVFPTGPNLALFVEAIKRGALPDVRQLNKNVSISPHSALLAIPAADHGSAEVIGFLHQNGLDVTGNSHLLLRTAQRGRKEIIAYLHQAGANIRAGNDEAVILAAEEGHTEALRYLNENGGDITRIDSTTQNLIRLNGYQSTLNYLTDSGLDALSDHRPQIEAMRDELYAAAEIYHPSKLWEHFNRVNMEQLRRDGLERFKRTVNQNYFNFVPHGLHDPQLRSLFLHWLAHPSMTFSRLIFSDPDIDSQSGRLLPGDRRIFRYGKRYGILSRTARKADLALYRWLVAMLWDFVRRKDRLGLADTLPEPRCGAPIEIFHDGRLISQDLAHSIMECNSILADAPAIDRRTPLRIAEIGAGYGRLGYVLLHAIPCQYVVFDIPPSLYVSEWYLSQLFPNKKIFRFRPFSHFEDIADEFFTSDIAFFSANQIELMPEMIFDISINISSLHELRPDQIENMLAQIYRTTSGYVYLKQYRTYINPYDDLVLKEDSYKIPQGWAEHYHRGDPVDSRFFETIIKRHPFKIRRLPDSLAPSSGGPAIRSPTVSVLLANYNHSQYLDTALSGICGQTLHPTEIIIVDDGSTDDSVAVIERFAKQFSNIRLLKNGFNRGQHYSIQRALVEARGDYVVWAASDDLLLPAFLERSLSVLKEHPDAGLCFSQLAVFVDGTQEVRQFDQTNYGVAFDYGQQARHLAPTELQKTLRRHYIWISGNTVVAKRSALLEIGFEKALRWHSDWFAFYVIALRYGVCMIPETLALMRERRDTYSRGGISNRDEQKQVLGSVLDCIKSPKYADLSYVFRRCPSLLSLFGRLAVEAALSRPRHWDIAAGLLHWHAPRALPHYYGKFRAWLAAKVRRRE